MSIQEKIKNRRLELGMSAEALAEKIGVAKSTVLRYESKGIEKLPIDLVRPLAKALDVTPSYLLGWDTVYSDPQDAEIVATYKDAPAPMQLPDDIDGLRLIVHDLGFHIGKTTSGYYVVGGNGSASVSEDELRDIVRTSASTASLMLKLVLARSNQNMSNQLTRDYNA